MVELKKVWAKKFSHTGFKKVYHTGFKETSYTGFKNRFSYGIEK